MQIQAPTIKELFCEFRFMRESFVEDIPGVLCVDSGIPGPTLGISIHTHGNEPSGLAVLWYLRNHYPLFQDMVCGKIYFVLNNIEATKRYFSALDIVDPKRREEEKQKSRFSDGGIDFNRLPPDTLSLTGANMYEIKRAQELRPIWKKFDKAIDIHSTSQDASPMIVACSGLHKELIAGFPIDVVLTNIENVQKNKPAIYFYGNRPIPTIGIESGCHEGEVSFICAIECALAFIRNGGIITGIHNGVSKLYKRYNIVDSILFPDISYRIVRVFEPFEAVPRGEIIARGEGPDIKAPFNAHLLFGPKEVKEMSVGEEIYFVSEPVETICV